MRATAQTKEDNENANQTVNYLKTSCLVIIIVLAHNRFVIFLYFKKGFTTI